MIFVFSIFSFDANRASKLKTEHKTDSCPKCVLNFTPD